MRITEGFISQIALIEILKGDFHLSDENLFQFLAVTCPRKENRNTRQNMLFPKGCPGSDVAFSFSLMHVLSH